MKIHKIQYYIYIDYSESFVGYIIVEQEKVKDLIPKISKLKHYRNLKHKKSYIHSIKKVFEKNQIKKYLLKYKINNIRENLIIFVEVIDFLKKNVNCKVFVSVDNNQFNSFRKLLNLTPLREIILVKESQLKKDSLEYKMSLIIDTMLNIRRLSR